MKKIIKTYVFSFIILALAIWTKSYYLIIILLLCVWFYLYRKEWTNFRKRLRKLPQKNKNIVRMTIATLVAIVIAICVFAYFIDIEQFYIPGKGQCVGIVNKMKYGVAKQSSSYPYYYRTCKLGHVERRDMAIIDVGDKRVASRIAGIAGDSVRVVDACVTILNALEYMEPMCAKASFCLSPNNSYKILHELERLTDIKLTDTTLLVMLPVRERMEKYAPNTYSPIPYNKTDLSVFPSSPLLDWNRNNMGPIYLPRKGDTIELCGKNIPIYFPVINKFEGVAIELIHGKVYCDGKLLKEYTFQYDYYWLMNDNRDCPYDSRIYGPIPEYQIVGKLFVTF